MSAITKQQKVYSLEEYLDLERSTDEKFEFWDGSVWSMSGATLPHNLIVRNLNTEMDVQLRKKGCNVFPSDLRIKVPDYPPYRYPDLTANCGEPVIERIGGIDMLVNPGLIVEVLSEETSLDITNPSKVSRSIYLSPNIDLTLHNSSSTAMDFG